MVGEGTAAELALSKSCSTSHLEKDHVAREHLIIMLKTQGKA